MVVSGSGVLRVGAACWCGVLSVGCGVLGVRCIVLGVSWVVV